MLIGICEDDREMRQRIRQEIQSFPTRRVLEIYEYQHGEEMLASDLAFDLVFLDIELGSIINGLIVAQKLLERNQKMLLVFVSGHTQYISMSFHLNAFQFILKPFRSEQFQEELRRCFKKYEEVSKDYLIKRNGEVFTIPVSEIVYIHSEGRELLVHRQNGINYRIYGQIGKEQERLAGHRFIRTHQSYLVNSQYIIEFHDEQLLVEYKNRYGRQMEKIPVSRRYKKEAKQYYRLYCTDEI